MAIVQGIQRAGMTGWRVGSLKTPASRREVSLTPETIDALKAHQRRQKAEYLKAGRSWDASVFVFQGPSGDFLKPHQSDHAHRRLIIVHRLPKHRFHDLRHSCATLLLKHGEQVHVVAKQLGHASVKMTLERYAHALPDQRKAVASRMSALLAG